MIKIKLRAWDKKWKKMFSVEQINIKKKLVYMDNYMGNIQSTLVDPVLMQWSGLQDSEGEDIYEGDIVYCAGYGNMEVEFPFLDLYDSGVEGDIEKILGNIYENPELLDRISAGFVPLVSVETIVKVPKDRKEKTK